MTLEEFPDLERVLQAMSPDDQALLVPYYVHGYTAEQLGEVFGVERRTINYRIWSAVRRTRKALGVKCG